MNAPGLTPRVAIIGAGFSGIAAAIALRRRGIDDFVIFEQAEGIGGTWWHNRYPGAEVDLESHIYSFSYERHDWSRTHAGWRELQGYLEQVAGKWSLRPTSASSEKVREVVCGPTRTRRTRSRTIIGHRPRHVHRGDQCRRLPQRSRCSRLSPVRTTIFGGAMCHTSAGSTDWTWLGSLSGRRHWILGSAGRHRSGDRSRQRSRSFSSNPTGYCPRTAATSPRWSDAQQAAVGLRRAPASCSTWTMTCASSGPATRGAMAGTTSGAANWPGSSCSASSAHGPICLNWPRPTFAFEGKRTVDQ